MNELIEKIFCTGHVEDAQGNRVYALGSAIEYRDGMALYDLVCKTKAQNTLEIGMGYGLSSLFICQAHHDQGGDGCHHIAIDPGQSSGFKSIGLLNIQRAGFENIFRFYEGYSYQILPRLLDNAERFDFIFIDGMHTFDYTLVDFFYADLLLNPGGHIMFHDVWMPSVSKVLSYALRNRQYRLVPELIWDPAPLLKRTLDILRSSDRRRVLTKHFVQHPLDISFITSSIYLNVKGGLKYWSVQKVIDDDRQWDYHKPF